MMRLWLMPQLPSSFSLLGIVHKVQLLKESGGVCETLGQRFRSRQPFDQYDLGRRFTGCDFGNLYTLMCITEY